MFIQNDEINLKKKIGIYDYINVTIRLQFIRVCILIVLIIILLNI